MLVASVKVAVPAMGFSTKLAGSWAHGAEAKAAVRSAAPEIRVKVGYAAFRTI
jgi:hypothetical protein